jgi:hypothetical protein
LDAASASRDGTHGCGAADSELQQFEDSIRRVDRRLRGSADRTPSPPPWLHEGIMNAIRAESRQVGSQPAEAIRWRWAAGWAALIAASAALLVIALRTLNGPDADQANSRPSISDLGSVFEAESPREVVDRAALLGASAMTGPLEKELEDLSRDASQAGQFLLAALP